MSTKNYTDRAAQEDVSTIACEPLAIGYQTTLHSPIPPIRPQSVSERVSPSKDAWFDIPENYQLALRAKANIGKGGKRFSHEELRQMIP